MKHLLSLEALSRPDMEVILQNAAVFKTQRVDSQHKPLAGPVMGVDLHQILHAHARFV
jgi:aspartate carbamoyltransferase catalytic subunit